MAAADYSDGNLSPTKDLQGSGPISGEPEPEDKIFVDSTLISSPTSSSDKVVGTGIVCLANSGGDSSKSGAATCAGGASVCAGSGDVASAQNETVRSARNCTVDSAVAGSAGNSLSSAATAAAANSAAEEAAIDVDRLSIDDISIASVQSGGGGGGAAGNSRRQNSITSRSSNCSSCLSVNAVPIPSVTTSDVGSTSPNSIAATAAATGAGTMTTTASLISNGFATSTTSVASSSSSSSSSFRSLSQSGISTPSNLEVGLHQPTTLSAPLASRASPLAATTATSILPSSSSSIANSCVINLNVGGFTFSTSLSTLVKYEDSMLAVMFSGRHPFSKDREGRYFIDRDGQYFGHILSYLRSDALPPEDVAQFVLREAEFFCLQSLIEKLESSSPRVIAVRRREYFRALIPDYDSIKRSIVGVASQKRTSFDESIVVLTQDNHAKLQGSIPCYNCTREPVCVTHDCTFKSNKSDITVKVKTQEINMDKMIGFIVNELSHDGFDVQSTVVLCKFSLRCHSCTMSGLYTAGGILAPRECPNMAHLLTFNW